MWWRSRRREHELEQKIDHLTNLITEGFKTMANKYDDLITQLNDNTNAVAARLDKLIAEVAAAGTAATPEQLAQFQAISDHLKALGADPAAPVPAPVPAPPADPSAPTS